MGEELLSLKWNNHQAHFVDILTFLREQEIFIDATLACGGKLYPAHKFVLSTCSEYFKQMFTKNPSKHPIVFLKDVTCKDLEALLDFMYHGEVNVPQSSLGSLIKTAEGLQIKGLAVPDDPPPHRTRANNDSRLYKRNRSSSPPSSAGKRIRDSRSSRSPLPNASASSHTNANNHADEESRTSNHSALSEHNNLNNNDDSVTLSDTNEPSPGTSGLQKPHSKEEPVEIKQENLDSGDIREDDEWREGELHLNDKSSVSINPSNFNDSGLLSMAENTHERAMDEGNGDPLSIRSPLEDWWSRGPKILEESLSKSPGHPTSVVFNNCNTTADVSLKSMFRNMCSSETDLTTLFRATMSDVSSSNVAGPDVSSNSEFSYPFFKAGNLSHNTLTDSNSSSFFQRPFSCPYCSRTFKRKYTLQEHIRIHLGQRPYSCINCSRSFTQSSSLWRHTKTCFKRRLSE